jgi:hypothetical protein
MLSGAGELGKEFAISAKRLGQTVVAVDRYVGAPAMQVADSFEVIDMLSADELERVVAKHKPEIIVPEIEAIRTEKLAEFEALVERFMKHRRDITDAKRPDYTIGNVDVLHNFKSVAERMGLNPLQVWGVYFLKHVDAICSFCKNPDKETSEPIGGRFADAANYLELGLGLIQDRSPKPVVQAN